MKRKPRLVAVVGLAGLLVLFALFVTNARPTRRIPDDGPGSLDSSAGRDVDRATEPSSERESPEKGSSEIVAPASTTEALRRPEVATADREPERRLFIRDVDGRELHEENGEFVLEPREGAKVLVPFRKGRFSLKGFPEGTVRIERAKAFSEDGDRPIAFEEEWFEFKFDEPTLLAGHYLPDCTLRVVDARTGVSLNDVSVLPRHAVPEQSHPGPHGDASFVVRDEASPVRLPRTRGIQPYWVTARGYGWSFILVDHETGGERVVQLESAGRLVVEVYGDIDSYMNQSLQVDIRVYSHASRNIVTSSHLEPGGFQGFEGIAVGTYDVKVELGSADGNSIVLGAAQVDVIANATSTARIELTHDEIPPPKVGVSGEIVVPKRYRTLNLRPSQRIQPADGAAHRHGDVLRILAPHGQALRYRDVIDIQSSAMDGRYGEEDGSEVFRWGAELSSGRYLFVVEPVQHGVVLDVPESPDAKIRIVLPDLHPVTLRVIDANTRQPINGATVGWSRPFEARDSDGWIEMDLEPGVESATVYLTAGPFSFAASAPNYGERSMDAYAGSGASQFTLELSPCIRREITLVQGETVVPWVQGMTCSFRSFGAKDTHPCENLGDGKMQACFGQPGVYEIMVGKLEGFRELAPVVVDVSKGDLSPVVVQLER